MIGRWTTLLGRRGGPAGFATPRPALRRRRALPALATVLLALIARPAAALPPYEADEIRLSDWSVFDAPPSDDPLDGPTSDPLEAPAAPANRPAAPSLGGGPMGPGGAPGYLAVWYPTQAIDETGERLGFVRQGLSLGAPLWTNGTDILLANFRIGNVLFDTDAILPDSGMAFPDQLWSISVGLNGIHRFDNGWTGGLMLGFGSASDQPFQSLDVMTFNAATFLRVPVCDGRDAWQFSLIYMVGGPANFPLPGVAYSWNPSEAFRVNLGIPFMLMWRPSERWTVDLTYMPLNNINARLTYAAMPRVKWYGGYEFLNDSYFLADRVDLNDRFFAVEQRLVTGVVVDVGQHAAMELNGGYSFGRYFAQGENVWATLSDQVDVDPGFFLGLALRLRI